MNIFSAAWISLFVSFIAYLGYREGIGRPVREPGYDKKLTWKKWLKLGVIVMGITFIIVFSIFWFAM